VAGFAADDLSHLLAELLENAASFSPPESPVEISGWLLENGEVMLSVQDEGIGMTEERLARLNARLADFDPETTYDQEGDEGLGLGLYVVARLAHRHGVRVQLREQKQGGIAAVAVLPAGLLAEAPAAAVPARSPHHAGAHAFSLPGAHAEANVLHGRPKSTDPLVALAEKAVRETGDAETAAPETGDAEKAAPETGDAETAVRETAAAEDAVDAVDAVRQSAEGQPGGPAAEREREHPAETTMELLIPAQASGEPAAADGEDAPQEPAAGEAEAEHTRTPDEDLLTDKGLPKRTPKITAPAQAPRQRSGGVDAEALRKRLGGFRRGAEAGQRDVQAEIAEQTGQNKTLSTESEAATGGTAEEASS
jgi:hypothetical protein